MSVVLKTTKRTETGTRDSRKLREKSQVPCIIYGHKIEPVAAFVNRHDLEVAIQHGERVITLDVEGTSESVLVKDVQLDTFGSHILHADFARVNLNEKVTVTVPITLRGTAVGTNEGGVLQQAAADVEIECIVNSIPDEIRANISELKVGGSLHMGDLVMPDGAILVSDPNALVCSISVVAEEEQAVEAEGDEGTAEPEVIGAKKEESEEE